MFSVRDGFVWWEERKLGPDTALLCAPKELASLNEKEGVLHLSTPHQIDMIFAVGEKVALVESKKPPDLVKSHAVRRLSRQVSTLIEFGDIPILLRRGGCDFDLLNHLTSEEQSHSKRWTARDFWQDMNVRLPMLGVFVVDVPDEDLVVRDWLLRCKEAFSGEPSRAVAKREAQPKERAPGWWLRRIPGVGMATSQKLHDEYGSTYGVMRAAVEGEWGGSEKMRSKIQNAGQ